MPDTLAQLFEKISLELQSYIRQEVTRQLKEAQRSQPLTVTVNPKNNSAKPLAANPLDEFDRITAPARFAGSDTYDYQSAIDDLVAFAESSDKKTSKQTATPDRFFADRTQPVQANVSALADARRWLHNIVKRQSV